MRYQFSGFRLDTDQFALYKGEQKVAVEPQVLELLILLIENCQRMVSKNELLETIWKGRYISDAALSSRIKSARQALGDDGKTQAFIRTVHKKGFQFVCPLDEGKTQTTQRAPEMLVARPAVAVLPFHNLSSDEEQEYFSDGVTGDIITHLSKHKWLKVVARNTAFGFKNKSIDSAELGNILKVNYLVEGSVQRVGNRVRINVHLVDTLSGLQIWADRYDGVIEDIFIFQDEITEKIAARLEPEIGFAVRNKIVHARPANLAAWDCYQLGVYHLFKFTGSDNEQAQKYLLESQQQDESFGEPYAWWAYAVVLGMVYWDTSPTQSLLDAALEACDKSLELDSQNASFYALRARVLLARKEYSSAVAENKIAISLNPTFAAAHCGLGDSLAYEGRYEEAVECFDRAIALSPNDPQLWAFLTYGALVQIFSGDYEKALEWVERASSIPNCQYWTHAHRVVALAYLGKYDLAEKLLSEIKHELPAFSCEFVREKLFYLKDKQQIELYIEGLKKAGLS